MGFDIQQHSHRRFNPLTGEWLQVSPHRAKRPWQGQLEKNQAEQRSSYDPGCYLCPGNKRSSDEFNPHYTATYSFTNDFPAIVENVPEGYMNDSELLMAKSEKGICKVICFSPNHQLTIAEMPEDNIKAVIQQWIYEYQSLSANPFINYIQIFENKGEVMGCSNPHPHGQIWAQESIPMEPQKKQENQMKYYTRHSETLLSAYLRLELKKHVRIVEENRHFVALVPFWAVWPFETMIIPKRPIATITEMSNAEIHDFASMYKRLTVRYDNLFQTQFPYSAGIHQAPCDGNDHREWHWHMVFYPPLLRSASVKKFMVGYEMLANPQRDVTAELAAEKLRSVSSAHYKQKPKITSVIATTCL